MKTLMLYLLAFVLVLGFYYPVNLDSDTLPDLVTKTLPAVVELRPGFDSLLGAGTLISDDGWIVTAKHVVKDQEVMVVTMLDGTKHMSILIIEDPNSDIAILKLDIEDAPHVKLCGRCPRLGSPVYAIGHPLGVFNSVSAGIVSGLHRNIYPYGLDLVQTDAEITNGNSGGGLFDMNGCLVGVVVAGTHYFTGIEMNLVVPIARGKKLLDVYLKQQEVAATCDDVDVSSVR